MNSFLIPAIIISGRASAVYEFAMWHEADGSYTIDAHASSCTNSSSMRFPITVGLYDISIINERYRSCDISLSTLADTTLRLDESTFFSSIADRSYLGVGPGSRFAATRGVDIIGTVMKMGTSFSQFEETCFPRSLFRVPTQSVSRVNSVTARFDLLNPTTSEYFNTSIREVVELKLVPGRRRLATLPQALALRLAEILTAQGAVRFAGRDLFSFTNCTLSSLPNLAIDFYTAPGSGSSVAGSILLTPAEFMPECEFRISHDGTSVSLDILKLPNINKRIGQNEIFLCDSLMET